MSGLELYLTHFQKMGAIKPCLHNAVNPHLKQSSDF